MPVEDETAAGTEGDSLARNGLVALFEDSPQVRILAALAGQPVPLRAGQIATAAGIDQSTFHRRKERLLETELLVEADTDAKTTEYRLARDDELRDGDERATWLRQLEAWTGRAIHDEKEYPDDV